MMDTPSLVLLLSCILISLRLSTSQFCSYTANFTSNTTYAKNRNLLLSSLASNTTAHGGFFTATLDQDSDTVYALALCRGDISTTDCFNCVNSSSHAIMTKCPNQKEVTDFSGPSQDHCIVRCSDSWFFGVSDALPSVFVRAPDNITGDVGDFDLSLNVLITSLSIQTAAGGSRLKFHSDENPYSGLYTITALTQCVPSLSPADCTDCLMAAVSLYQGCCARSRTVNIMKPSCTFQYFVSPLFAAPLPSPSPPPSTPIAPPPPPSTNTTSKENSMSRTFHIAIIVVPTSILLVLIAVGCAFSRLRKREDAGSEDASQSVRADSLRFDFATIRTATNDFSDANKLGHGGFGSVYKGKLKNRQEIAVKRLASPSKQGEVEFKNEIVLMTRLQHKNLVRLIGFCLQGKERLLVYEFVPNASLDRFIFDPIKRMLLNWETRHKIIIGIACGLLYLHEDSQLRIIHRDLKAANVLLDGEMNPKIADFGMARLFVVDQSKGKTKKIAGTVGYMPPEYATYGRFSMKTDVFSFGVLILEIVSGKRNGACGGPEHAEHLISYAWTKWTQGKISSLFDQTLSGGSKRAKMRCIHIGLLCVQENVAKRPTIGSVVLMLYGVRSSLPEPTKPAFLMQSSPELPRNTISHDKCLSKVKSSDQSIEHPVDVSVNETSITEPGPR